MEYSDGNSGSTCTKGYWDSPHPGVPEKFAQAVAEEPWRGLFEPCEDHPLTEIEVEGEVPPSLEGTLFRNGKRLSAYTTRGSAPTADLVQSLREAFNLPSLAARAPRNTKHALTIAIAIGSWKTAARSALKHE